MTTFPNTTSKEVSRRWTLCMPVAVVLVALALGIEAFLRAENFSPKKEIVSSSFEGCPRPFSCT